MLLLSFVFGALFLYFAVLAVVNRAYNFGVLVIELLVGLIAYSLGVFSVRLITGRGIRGGKQLLSNASLTFWGTVFGVAGTIELVLLLMNRKLDMLAPGIFSIAMGLGAYQLVRTRKSK